MDAWRVCGDVKGLNSITTRGVYMEQQVLSMNQGRLYNTTGGRLYGTPICQYELPALGTPGFMNLFQLYKQSGSVILDLPTL